MATVINQPFRNLRRKARTALQFQPYCSCWKAKVKTSATSSRANSQPTSRGSRGTVSSCPLRWSNNSFKKNELMVAPPWSEVERIAQPLECLFLFLQIPVTQPLEASLGAEFLQKTIHFHAQGIIPFAHADSPGLFLERDKQCRGCCPVALPILVD